MASDTCVIDGMCVNGGTLKDPGNCSMACNPNIDPYKWTMAAPDTQCDPDPASCAIGACTNTGQCLTTSGNLGGNPKDGQACTQNNCNGMCYQGFCQDMGSSMYDQCTEGEHLLRQGDDPPKQPVPVVQLRSTGPLRQLDQCCRRHAVRGWKHAGHLPEWDVPVKSSGTCRILSHILLHQPH